MVWSATAEVSRFDEAADWFSSRTVISADEAKTINADTRNRAFWVGGGLQLEQIQRVFDSLQKAQDSGIPFEEWRKQVKDVLRDDNHALTVFRNAAQRAYSAGRWQQLHAPDVLRFRPYFMFDAVLDLRTTELCRSLDSIILPSDHPFWQTRVPPLHHRCRSGIRSLRRGEAERRGISTAPPQVDPPEGWGLAPEPDKDAWKPEPEKHDPELVQELERKSANRDNTPETTEPSRPSAPSPQRRPQAPRVNPKHQPSTYREDYAQYGTAGERMAYGKALEQRMLDRPWDELSKRLKELQEAGHPMLVNVDVDMFASVLPGRSKARNMVLPGWVRNVGLIAEHSLGIDTGGRRMRDMISVQIEHPSIDKALVFWETMADKSVRLPTGLRVIVDPSVGRSQYDPRTHTISLTDPSDIATLAHEIGHAVERAMPERLAESKAFFRRRTENSPPVKMSELTGNRNYSDHEYGRDDHFVSKYVGRDYEHNDYNRFATEVMSVGVENMISDIERFSAKDREHLLLTLGQLAGDSAQ